MSDPLWDSDTESMPLRNVDRRLIDLVKSHPALYDHSLPEYRNHDVREKIWKEIGEKIDRKAQEAKFLWLRLKKCFNYHRNKKHTGTTPAYKWKYEDDMAFLSAFNKRSRSNFIEDTNDHIYVIPPSPDGSEPATQTDEITNIHTENREEKITTRQNKESQTDLFCAWLGAELDTLPESSKYILKQTICDAVFKEKMKFLTK